MCFGSTMSKTTKDLTASTVNLANMMASQASKVFGAADQTFHTISSALTSIVNRGEQQFGFSGGQFQAMNAAAVNAGATEKRNLTAQAATSGQPFNAARIDQDVANQTATAENNIMQAGYKQGNENFWQASQGLERAPSVYGVAGEFDKNAMDANQTAIKSQENRDAASAGGWKGLVKAGLTVAGDIGGSFIGDPGLGGQVMGAFGGGAKAGGGGSGLFGMDPGNVDSTGGSSIWEKTKQLFGDQTGNSSSGSSDGIWG